jgi:hypothetical protein
MSQINVNLIQPSSGSLVTIDGNLTVTGTNSIRPYKVYVGALSQSSPTSNPIVGVFENTLGATITWTRSSTGVYLATSSSPVFTAFKTIAFTQVSGGVGSAPGSQFIVGRQSDTQVFFLTQLNDSVSTPADGRFAFTPIEIRVYP